MAALRAEYIAYPEALDAENIVLAWQHLERARIVAQPLLVQHLRSHRLKLRKVLHQRDMVEIAGQVIRFLLVSPGNATGRLPAGNSGRARVSAFRPMSVPADLERLVR